MIVYLKSSISVNSLPPGNFFKLFCRPLIFFQNQLFSKKNQEYHLSGKQTVCKSYQQTTQGDKELI